MHSSALIYSWAHAWVVYTSCCLRAYVDKNMWTPQQYADFVQPPLYGFWSEPKVKKAAECVQLEHFISLHMTNFDNGLLVHK